MTKKRLKALQQQDLVERLDRLEARLQARAERRVLDAAVAWREEQLARGDDIVPEAVYDDLTAAVDVYREWLVDPA